MWLLAIACVLVVSATAARAQQGIPADLREGDLVFVSLPCYACDLIEKTTRSPYSHVAIVSRENGTGPWQAIMAVEPQVTATDLAWLISKSREPAMFARYEGPDGYQRARVAARFARGYLGTPYDGHYASGDEQLYCSELVYYSFMRANGGYSPFDLKPMDFSADLAAWRTALGQEPPQGQLGISPGDLIRSPVVRPLAQPEAASIDSAQIQCLMQNLRL